MRYVLMGCVLGTALLVGCNTVDRRIRRNLDTFNSFPVEIQEKIRHKQVDIGFTKEMATIALGRPDRIYTRKTSRSKTEVWAYIERENSSSAGVGVIISPHPHHSYGGFFLAPGFTFADSDETYERLRVEWDGDKVKAIEEIQDQ